MWNDNLSRYLSTISAIGIIGNLIVALVYWKKKDKQTATLFILLLAFVDLIVCMLLVPLTIYMELILYVTDNIVLCKSFTFLTTTTVPSSTLLMTAIAFDRYFCICMANRNILTLRKARFIGIILIVFSGCLGVIPALASVIQTPTPSKQELSSHQEEDSVSSSSSASLTSVSLSSSSEVFSSENSSYSNQTNLLCFIDSESVYTIFGHLIQPFKIFYDLIFVCSAITITILYILIYKEIYTRRKIKREQKQKLLYNSYKNTGGVTENLERETSLFSRACFCFKNDDDIGESIMERGDSIRYRKATSYAKNSEQNNQNTTNDQNNFELTNVNDLEQKRLTSTTGTNNQPNANVSRLSIQFSRNVISTKDIRTAFMLFVVSVLFIAFYLPSIIATNLSLYFPNINLNLYVSYLYFLNSAINPIIYCFLNPNFRSDLLKLFLPRKFINRRRFNNVK